jgi:DNA-binding transcriptional MerR regulator
MNNNHINLENFTADKVLVRSNEGLEKLAEVDQALKEPKYTLGNLNINRNTFVYWMKKGLVPYQDEVAEGWRKFSFLECTWLKVILQFRALGVSIEKIKVIKEALFDPIRYLEEMNKKINTPEASSEFHPEVIEAFTSADDQELLSLLEEEKRCLFSDLILSALLHQKGFGIYLTAGGVLGLSELANITVGKEPYKFLQDLEGLMNTSFILVNVWPIVMDLLFIDGIKVKNALESSILSKEEMFLLGLIRSGQFKEILIKMDETGAPIQLELKKEGISQEVLHKVYHYLKKGKFEHIQLKTRDGQLIQYSETQVVKLRNKNPKTIN